MLIKSSAAALALALLAAPAMAQTATMMTALPSEGSTVTNWYKQNVYDPAEKKIGEIEDVLVDREGKISALIVSVGGFLGIGDKDVAVPFNAVASARKDGKWYLTMSTTADALKAAPGYKYDKTTTTWVPDTK